MKSLKAKYLLTFFLLALIPYGLSVAYFSGITYTDAQDEAIDKYETLARIKQSLLDRHLQSFVEGTKSLSENHFLQDFMEQAEQNGKGDSDTQKNATEILLNYQESIWGKGHHVFVADVKGKVVLSPPHGKSKGSHLGDHIEHPAFKEALKGEVQVTDFFGFSEKNHYHQLCMHPIKKNEKVLGAIIVEIVISDEVKILKQDFKLGKTGKIFMTDLKGVEIVHSKPELKEALVRKGITEALSKGHSEQLFNTPDGKGYLGYYIYDSKYPWVLCVEAEQDEVFASAKAFLKIGLIAGLIVCIIVAFVATRLALTFSRPVLLANTFAKKITDQDFSPLEVKGKDPKLQNDELGSLHVSLESMRQSLKELIEDLDKKVRIKTRDVSLILENIPTGLLTFKFDGRIEAEYSEIIESFFEGSVKGKPVEEILFVSEKSQKDFKAWYDFIQDSPLPFEDSAGLAENECHTENKAKPRSLEYSFTPIYKDEGSEVLEKIMVIIEDVTAQKELARQMRLKEEKTEFILKVLRAKSAYTEFLKECNRCIESLKELSIQDSNEEKISEAFRYAHTIKGNSGSYSITELADTANALESHLALARENKNAITDSYVEEYKGFLVNLEASFAKHVDETENLFGESFHISQEESLDLSIRKVKLSKIEEQLGKMNHTQEISVLSQMLHELRKQPIGSLLNSMPDYVKELAKRLGKSLAPLEIKGAEIEVNLRRLKPFLGTFVHLIRNCVDHGIEDPDTREKCGKDEEGKVSIKIEKHEGFLSILVADDGAGLNVEAIKNKAIEKNLKSKEDLDKMKKHEIFKLIFSSGLSTKLSISETSGRGVGMDAVRFEVEKLGGNISIHSEEGKGSTFVISIPEEKIIE